MPGGRPTKLNDETQNAILKAIRKGAYVETAAAHAGIEKNTLYDWMKRGRRERQRINNGETPNPKETPFAKFSTAIEKEFGEAELRDLDVITKAGQDGQWQASAWRLERKFPDRWGKRSRVELTGANGSHIQVGPAIDLSKLTTEEIEVLYRLLDKSKQAQGELNA